MYFDLDPDGKHLVPNPEEQSTIGLMHRWKNAGASLRTIADRLNRQGIRSKNGKRWVHVQVDRVLKQAERQTQAVRQAG